MATNGSSGPQPGPGFANNPFAAAAATATAAAAAAAAAGSVAPDAARCDGVEDGVEDDAVAAAAPSPGWSVYGTVRWAVDPLVALVWPFWGPRPSSSLSTPSSPDPQRLAEQAEAFTRLAGISGTSLSGNTS